MAVHNEQQSVFISLYKTNNLILNPFISDTLNHMSNKFLEKQALCQWTGIIMVLSSFTIPVMQPQKQKDGDIQRNKVMNLTFAELKG